MQDYKTDNPFDISLSEDQQMTWDMLRKFAETEMRSCARQAETDGRPSEDLLKKIKGLDLISLIIPEDFGAENFVRLNNVMGLLVKFVRQLFLKDHVVFTTRSPR